ncbi:unnamed protein product, partial [Sphacelaria rigidula]
SAVSRGAKSTALGKVLGIGSDRITAERHEDGAVGNKDDVTPDNTAPITTATTRSDGNVAPAAAGSAVPLDMSTVGDHATNADDSGRPGSATTTRSKSDASDRRASRASSRRRAAPQKGIPPAGNDPTNSSEEPVWNSSTRDDEGLGGERRSTRRGARTKASAGSSSSSSKPSRSSKVAGIAGSTAAATVTPVTTSPSTAEGVSLSLSPRNETSTIPAEDCSNVVAPPGSVHADAATVGAGAGANARDAAPPERRKNGDTPLAVEGAAHKEAHSDSFGTATVARRRSTRGRGGGEGGGVAAPTSDDEAAERTDADDELFPATSLRCSQAEVIVGAAMLQNLGGGDVGNDSLADAGVGADNNFHDDAGAGMGDDSFDAYTSGAVEEEESVSSAVEKKRRGSVNGKGKGKGRGRSVSGGGGKGKKAKDTAAVPTARGRRGSASTTRRGSSAPARSRSDATVATAEAAASAEVIAAAVALASAKTTTHEGDDEATRVDDGDAGPAVPGAAKKSRAKSSTTGQARKKGGKKQTGSAAATDAGANGGGKRARKGSRNVPRNDDEHCPTNDDDDGGAGEMGMPSATTAASDNDHGGRGDTGSGVSTAGKRGRPKGGAKAATAKKRKSSSSVSSSTSPVEDDTTQGRVAQQGRKKRPALLRNVSLAAPTPAYCGTDPETGSGGSWEKLAVPQSSTDPVVDSYPSGGRKRKSRAASATPSLEAEGGRNCENDPGNNPESDIENDPGNTVVGVGGDAGEIDAGISEESNRGSQGQGKHGAKKKTSGSGSGAKGKGKASAPRAKRKSGVSARKGKPTS